MNGIILYQSKYGATKKYAQWLSEKTGFPCVETKQARVSAVREYDTILLGGGIYTSGIAGLSFLKKNIKELQGKKIIVFCVGASPYEEKAYREIVARNMKDELSDIGKTGQQVALCTGFDNWLTALTADQKKRPPAGGGRFLFCSYFPN